MLSTFQILFYPFWHSCVGCNLSPIFWIKKLRPKRIKWSWQKNLGTQEKQQLGFSYLDGSPKTLLISIWWNAGVPGAAAREIETSRDITFPTKVHRVKALVFPVVMYGYESWTTKKAERQRIDAFELWCWRRLLRVPWTARRSNQSILKEISLNILWKDWCWSWNSNPLAIWFEELTHLKRSWCWERFKAGGKGDDRGWDGCMVSLSDGHEFE